MQDCRQVQAGFTEYLDGRLGGRAMQEISAHLDQCPACEQEWNALRRTQAALSDLGPVPEPRDLLLRIRVALSQERARRRRFWVDTWALAWKNTVGPFLLQATAGFASAVLLLGTVVVMVSVFAKPQTAQAVMDEPLSTTSAPHLLYLSSGAGTDDLETGSEPVVVEAYVNDAGQVYDYRILSGPTDPATRSEVENLLLFSVFAPARFFGQPVPRLRAPVVLRRIRARINRWRRGIREQGNKGQRRHGPRAHVSRIKPFSPLISQSESSMQGQAFSFPFFLFSFFPRFLSALFPAFPRLTLSPRLTRLAEGSSTHGISRISTGYISLGGASVHVYRRAALHCRGPGAAATPHKPQAAPPRRSRCMCRRRRRRS